MHQPSLVCLCLSLIILIDVVSAGRLQTTIDKTNVVVKWHADYEDQTVLFSVNLSNSKFEAFVIGWSDHGFYNHSDACLFHNGTLMDYYINSAYELEMDRSQDCVLERASKTSFTFRRRFSTCDPYDYAFESGATQFILAGLYETTWNFNNPMVFKMMRYDLLFEGELHEEKIESEANTFSILADDANMPAEETTYWCIVKKLPKDVLEKKHHIIKMGASIRNGSEHFVHHMEIYMCMTDDQTEFSGNCNDKNKPKAASSCSHVVAAWAMGEDDIVYPPEAGFPVGGPGAHQYFMVEMHYNNPQLVAGVVDRSGFFITVTPKLREHDAAIMELGLIYGDMNSIPPGQAAFPITGHCTADCTMKLPEDGIYIFASQLHMHLTGRKIWTSVYRNDVKISEVNRDNHYSPHWQHLMNIVPFTHVKRGDVLKTTCVYDTRARSGMTFGGYAISNEMCVNYIYYYPASDIEVCKSAIDNATLHSYFENRYRIPDDGKLLIHEKYDRIEWTQDNVYSLQTLYNTAPIQQHCLMQDGKPFSGHSTKWENMQQARSFAGPFVKTRDLYECPSLNDV